MRSRTLLLAPLCLVLLAAQPPAHSGTRQAGPARRAAGAAAMPRPNPRLRGF